MPATIVRSFLAAVALASAGMPSAFAQTTERVSVDSAGFQGNGTSDVPATSIDARFTAFSSDADNLVASDTNGCSDVFVHDRLSGITDRVSIDSAGVQGNGPSGLYGPSISDDGRFVSFASEANNLVLGDTNSVMDIFLHDRLTRQTSRVSVSSIGAQSNARSQLSRLSASGRFIAFDSGASNLVSGDTNGAFDVFLYDQQAAVTTRVSVSTTGGQGDGDSWYPSISDDGRYVAFASYASNLVSVSYNQGVFVHEPMTGQTILCSVDSAGIPGNGQSSTPSISSDGTLAFSSEASNLVPNDTNNRRDVFVHHLPTSLTQRISVDSGGIQANDVSTRPEISNDGRFIAFESYASNLLSNDTNATFDAFLHDRQTGKTSCVSVDSAGVQGSGSSDYPSISADGRYVAFQSNATNLVPGDTNGRSDVFVHDRGASGPSLAKTGTCPGAITLTISNATAGGLIALISGPAGNFVQQSLPCQGLVLVISPPTLRALFSANGSGAVVLNFNAPAGACGLSVQAVDVTSCAATNAIVL